MPAFIVSIETVGYRYTQADDLQQAYKQARRTWGIKLLFVQDVDKFTPSVVGDDMETTAFKAALQLLNERGVTGAFAAVNNRSGPYYDCIRDALTSLSGIADKATDGGLHHDTMYKNYPKGANHD